MSDKPVVAVFPEPGAWGPTNNLVAICNHLLERDIRVVFVIDDSFKGELEKRGFEEALMRMSPPPDRTEEVGDVWIQFIKETAPEFRKPTIEQLGTVIKPIWEELVGGVEYSHPRLMEIWQEVQPDVIVSDNVTGFGAVQLAGVPWVRMVSANPLEMKDPNLPPAFSGYTSNDKTGWVEFREEYLRIHQPLMDRLSEINVSHGADPLPPGEFQYDSPWLNLYSYPGELDYERAKPLDATWHRLDSTVRTSDAAFDVNEHLPGGGKLIYLSLGSLGCMDVKLMQRIVDVLDKTEHRVIVSMGPLHEQLKLGDRMYGEQFLPQAAILPQCDLLITHGGNNTFGETFTFGLPTIVLPLFWDQYDNGQRVADLGYGERLGTYTFEPEELTGAITRLTEDSVLAEKLKATSERLQREPGRIKGADLIEQVVRTREPVLRAD